MGRALLVEEPVFRQAIESLDRRCVPTPIGHCVRCSQPKASSPLDRVEVSQPVLFAMDVALAALWRSWGVEPDAVVGHSMGEIAAAHVAGALSLEDAVAIVSRRSTLIRRISGQGEMAVVMLSVADAERAITGYEESVSVAVSSSPRSTVLSGAPEPLSKILGALEARGVFCQRVKVDFASHSPQVDPLREDLLEALDPLRPRATTIAMRSTVTGQLVGGSELVGSYWADNLRQPVRFAEVVQGLLNDGFTSFVEMSPHPLLVASVEELQQATGHDGAAVMGSLQRAAPERQAMLEAIGVLHANGHAVDWKKIFPRGGRRVDLPTYAWQREHFWIDSVPAASSVGRTGTWPLFGLGIRMPGAGRHHIVQVGPRHQAFPGRPRRLRKSRGTRRVPPERRPRSRGRHLAWSVAELTGIEFLHAIAMDPNGAVELHAIFTPDDDGLQFELATFARRRLRRLEHPRARARRSLHGRGDLPPRPRSARAARRRGAVAVSHFRLFEEPTSIRGPLWRWMRRARTSGGTSSPSSNPRMFARTTSRHCIRR